MRNTVTVFGIRVAATMPEEWIDLVSSGLP
jgi:hypothetical protein